MSTTYQFTVSPDFAPDRISGWFIFNTWLQRTLGEHIHLELYSDFETQRRDIGAGRIDLIYANPSDAALLVREKGFAGIARPVDLSDEAVLVVAADSPVQRVEDLRPGARVASTDHPDVRMMGMIMLEPADLDRTKVADVRCDSYVIVARALVTGKADVGICLKQAYDDLSPTVRKTLRPLVTSAIQLVRHGLMAGPRLAHRRDDLMRVLLGMHETPQGRDALANLGFQRWEEFAGEEVEFMIDLMDTLAA